MAATLLLLVPDLFFQARLDTAARRLGLKVVRASDWKSALAAARDHPPEAAIVDLGASAATGPFKFLEKLRSEAPLRGVRSLGFLEHMKKDLAEKARKAGCGTVVAKGALSLDTPAYLRRITADLVETASAPAPAPAPKPTAASAPPRPPKGRKRDEEE